MLIASGTVQKYLVYTIGEIALVVIGILIALQINNWNEWRNDRVKEKTLLVEVLESVKSNKNLLEEGLVMWQSTTRGIDIITHAMKNELPFADSLKTHYRWAHQTRGNNLNALDFAGYKSLENTGYSILTNQSLRKQIVTLFESELPKLVYTNDQIDFDNSGFHAEYIVRHFIPDQNGEYPLDYKMVMKDPYYYSILRRLDGNLIRKMNRVRRTLPKVEEVIESLEKELVSK